jgi:hypothetical protein
MTPLPADRAAPARPYATPGQNPFCERQLPIVNHWNGFCWGIHQLPAARLREKADDAMKIWLLIILIGAIVAAYHQQAKVETPAQAA